MPQPLTTVCSLPVTSVTIDDQGVSLTLGDTPLLLPEPLDTIAHRLVERRRGNYTTGHTSDSPWLFPGGFAGRHLSNERLGTRLKRLGI
jgi:hypothetical protein